MYRRRHGCSGTLRASLIGAFAVVIGACGGATPRPPVDPGAQESETPIQSAEAPAQTSGVAGFAGEYGLSGTVEEDACGARVNLAAENIRVDANAQTLHADVVERTYGISLDEEGRLIAEGRFPSSTCPQSTLYERWTFTKTQTGILDGRLDSVWLLGPECARPCRTRFRVRAARRVGPSEV